MNENEEINVAEEDVTPNEEFSDDNEVYEGLDDNIDEEFPDDNEIYEDLDDNLDEEFPDEELKEKPHNENTSVDEKIKSDKPDSYTTYDKKTIIIIIIVLAILYGLYIYFTFFQ